MMSNLKVSIITVCYNACDDLKLTAESVLAQKYEDIEYIVVDGGSTDGTLEYLMATNSRAVVEKIDFKYLSEPDKGIYDAMNKGTRLSTGEYLLFLNAGDVFADNMVLSKVFSRVDGKQDVIYGNHYTSGEKGIHPVIAGEPNELCKTMIFSHQAAFIKREEQLQNPYDTKYNICADYNFFLDLYLNGKDFLHLPVFISVFQEGGLCQQDVNATTKQVFAVRREKGIITKKNYVYYALKRWQYVLRMQGISAIKRVIARKRG